MASISSYKLKDGKKAWEFYIFAGVDPQTGKEIKIPSLQFKCNTLTTRPKRP